MHSAKSPLIEARTAESWHTAHLKPSTVFLWRSSSFLTGSELQLYFLLCSFTYRPHRPASCSEGTRWAVWRSSSWLRVNYGLGRSEEPLPREEAHAPKEVTSGVVLSSQLCMEWCSGHSRSWVSGPAGSQTACGQASSRRNLVSLGTVSLTSHWMSC